MPFTRKTPRLPLSLQQTTRFTAQLWVSSCTPWWQPGLTSLILSAGWADICTPLLPSTCPAPNGPLDMLSVPPPSTSHFMEKEASCLRDLRILTSPRICPGNPLPASVSSLANAPSHGAPSCSPWSPAPPQRRSMSPCIHVLVTPSGSGRCLLPSDTPVGDLLLSMRITPPVSP